MCKAKKQYKAIFFLVKNKYDGKSGFVFFCFAFVFLKQTLQDHSTNHFGWKRRKETIIHVENTETQGCEMFGYNFNP